LVFTSKLHLALLQDQLNVTWFWNE